MSATKACSVCLGSRARPFARLPSFVVLECPDCAFRFVDATGPGYPRDAQYLYDQPFSGPARPGLPHVQRRLADVLRLQSPPGRALDVGCGRGEVSLAFHAAGFECTGMDIKERVVARLRQEHPEIRWVRSTLDELALGRETFDVVTLYHVLEHLPDPRLALRLVRSIARPGALVAVEVPHVAGAYARLKGRRWQYYKVDHVSYFRPEHVNRLAQEAGLEPLDAKPYNHFSYPQGVAWKDAVKAALARAGFADVISMFFRVR